MKSKEIVLSKKKAIIFGIVIDILVTTIISYGGYDAVNAFYGEIMPLSRKSFFLVLFPHVLIIIAAIILAFTFISIKYPKKTK